MASTNVPAVDDISTLPQPSHITLLLRHHKSTTLISVSPTQSFESIKDLLLAALKAREVSSLHNESDPTDPTPLPSSAADLEFGVLIDKKDASKGWTLLTPDLATAAASSGKKKAASKSGDVNSPAGAGLVDGSWLAYRVRKSTQTEGDDANIGEDGDVDIDMEEDPGWDVVLPSFEDEEEEAEEEDVVQAGPS